MKSDETPVPALLVGRLTLFEQANSVGPTVSINEIGGYTIVRSGVAKRMGLGRNVDPQKPEKMPRRRRESV